MMRSCLWLIVLIDIGVAMPLMAQLPPSGDCKTAFFSLIQRSEGDQAPDWPSVLTASGLPNGPAPGVRPSGITQQIGAGGPRGRIFLPTAVPDDLGYYTRPIDVLVGNPLRWGWNDWLGGPPALSCTSVPSVTVAVPSPVVLPSPDSQPATISSTDLTLVFMQLQINHAAVMAGLAEVRKDIAEFRAAVRSKWLDFVNHPIVKYGTVAILGILAKWGYDHI